MQNLLVDVHLKPGLIDGYVEMIRQREWKEIPGEGNSVSPNLAGRCGSVGGVREVAASWAGSAQAGGLRDTLGIELAR